MESSVDSIIDDNIIKQQASFKIKMLLKISENIFSICMLAVFEYLSFRYLQQKYFYGGIDENSFWLMFNHVTPFFVTRGLQINFTCLILNIRQLFYVKRNKNP